MISHQPAENRRVFIFIEFLPVFVSLFGKQRGKRFVFAF